MEQMQKCKVVFNLGPEFQSFALWNTDQNAIPSPGLFHT